MRIVMDQLTEAIALTRASVSDISSLVRIHLAAFAYDNAACLIRRNEDNYEEELQSMLEIDLREYAPGGKNGRQGWGIFEFVYMLRLPDTKKA